ncbi:Crp-like helix-turn-helix domain protein [compost metagenome]
MALRRSTIAFLPFETFQWLLDTSLPFTRFLLTQLNERLGQFIAAVEYERSLDIDSRVARAVSSLFNEHLYPGIGKTLEISQEEIGLLAGISRQRANQALKVLEQQKLVRVDYGVIEALDLDGLRQYGE